MIYTLALVLAAAFTFSIVYARMCGNFYKDKFVLAPMLDGVAIFLGFSVILSLVGMLISIGM